MRLLELASLALVVLVLGIGCIDESSQRPNILFIMSDDHTSQAWGIYGGVLEDVAHTPNIRRLAREGATLENVFCTNSICVPSRASILTGQYSHENEVYTLSDVLDPKSPTIAKELQQSGYQTALFGKWHLKSRPQGFDSWRVLPGQGRYQDPVLKDSSDWESGGQVYQGFSTDVIAEQSMEWLESRDSDKPFFLMTHFKATHEPFDYPDRLEDLYAGGDFPEPQSLYDFGPETNGRNFVGQKLWILGERWVNASEKLENRTYPGLPFSLEGLDSLQQRRKIYQKFVADFLRSGAAIDENIGRILDYLDARDLTNNTIVIYTADQGYFLGEHGMFDKRMMYEEALRMPFVVRYPPEIPGGSRPAEMILNIDIPALFADYAGLEKPDFVRGASFRRILSGELQADWRTDMYYRYWLHREERPAHFGIRNEKYKLIFFYGLPLEARGTMPKATEPGWEFYDLQLDPLESQNAYDNPEYSDRIQEMKERLLELRKLHGDEDLNSEQLRSLIKEHY